jgi:hypothetical protein
MTSLMQATKAATVQTVTKQHSSLYSSSETQQICGANLRGGISTMRKIFFAFIIASGIVVSLISVSARNHSDELSTQKSSRQLSPDEVIQRFTTKESELFEIWKQYSYMQESKLQVLGPANTISGEFYQVSEFVFNDSGKRIERILKAPVSTLDQTGLSMSPEDRNAFVNLQPFALRSEDLPNYQVNYVGKEKVDELNCYVFEVTPKVMLNQRELERLKKQKVEGKFFQGKIWVDDEDLQIVKTSGKTVPEFDQRFPKFETYRENIDGRYWLPTFTIGDDILDFPKVRFHVKMIIKYKNYRQFQSDVKLLDVDEVKDGTTKPQEKGKPDEAKPDLKRQESKKEETKTKPRPRP